MAKYRIIFDREACIGAMTCVSASQAFWKIAKDGKVDLNGAKLNKKTGNYELIIDEKNLLENKEAAEVCPVNVIKINPNYWNLEIFLLHLIFNLFYKNTFSRSLSITIFYLIYAVYRRKFYSKNANHTIIIS